MLRMQGVSKVFQVGEVMTHALRSIDLSVQEGDFLSITGPSGSGKSTLLNILGLLEGFSGGHYAIGGVDVGGMRDAALSALRNEKIGFVFQAFNLIPDLTIQANVEVPLRYRGMAAAECRQRVASALAQVGLGSRMSHYPGELSGGQQQRAAIARAIAGTPALLLADEPTGNLDSQMSQGVMEILRELNQGGMTIIMVTHDKELAACAGRSVHIVDGQIVEVTAQAMQALCA
ncbi:MULTISPECIES: ABC transporter ATP-binding protein [Stenotrophomonas]|uniref:ABC transporter ATP-binding protein n=1 Tax=Stenotrophomonas TaxID=40323 RepID=UPI00066A3F95|nr:MULTISPECIES: ABC transporter ATP-binding protein [Stenotrophomonas]KOQ62411.1 ABC transporter ATP-binding protein [Stenotrophomonas maltophilia]KZE49139.1 ABC transporter ATP-binding protein [Stenotrophomonas maltophilia]MBH1360122.1 ABC transporter ATP-binding protein [Stenotrophomonas maltophilia]MBH1510709.1 ABC transporter ATP-binding protein [Stenotrophomonas maltophilia]MBH1544572.1 ABC transporter ATP-binding protein [Stenotrophomonas maltophilia]